MAQIGYGYGSEWQLLRFLGHHRELFEREIREQLKLNSKSSFKWLDFEFDNNEKFISGDKEITGLNFLKHEMNLPADMSFEEYPTGWQRSQSWDAVVKIDGIIYLVEAKAHIGEISDKKQHGGSSQEQILAFMNKQLKAFGCMADIKKDTWLGEYYQMANRLAVAAYLCNKGIPTKVLYVYFENGYNNPFDKSDNKDASRELFESVIKKEKETLGITNDNKVNKLLCEVFINATPNKTIE